MFLSQDLSLLPTDDHQTPLTGVDFHPLQTTKAVGKEAHGLYVNSKQYVQNHPELIKKIRTVMWLFLTISATIISAHTFFKMRRRVKERTKNPCQTTLFLITNTDPDLLFKLFIQQCAGILRSLKFS